MFVCIPQTCLTIRQVNHCKPKLLSILHSSSMIFSSTLWIELTTVWGSGYSNAYTHKRNKTLTTSGFFSSFFFFCYTSSIIFPTKVLCWSYVDSHKVQITLVSEINLKWNLSSSNEEYVLEREERNGEFTLKKKKKSEHWSWNLSFLKYWSSSQMLFWANLQMP